MQFKKFKAKLKAKGKVEEKILEHQYPEKAMTISTIYTNIIHTMQMANSRMTILTTLVMKKCRLFCQINKLLLLYQHKDFRFKHLDNYLKIYKQIFFKIFMNKQD